MSPHSKKYAVALALGLIVPVSSAAVSLTCERGPVVTDGEDAATATAATPTTRTADNINAGTSISSLRFIPTSLFGPNLGPIYPPVRGSCASRGSAPGPTGWPLAAGGER